MKKFLALFIPLSFWVIVVSPTFSAEFDEDLSLESTTDKFYLEVSLADTDEFHFNSDSDVLSLSIKEWRVDTPAQTSQFETGPARSLSFEETRYGLTMTVRVDSGTHYALLRNQSTNHLLLAVSSADDIRPINRTETMLSRGMLPATSGTDESTRTTGPTLDLNVKNAELEDVLRAIATKGNVNVVTQDDVSGQVTLRLNDVGVETALNAILKPRGYTFRFHDNIYEVFSTASEESEPEKRGDTVTYRDEQLLIDVREYPLKKLLTDLSRLTPISVLFPESVSGNVTLYLDDLSPQRAVEQIIQSQNLQYTEQDGLYRVLSGETAESKPRFDLSVDTHTVSVDVSEADLKKLLEDFIHRADLNMVMYGEVRGTVNARLTDVPIEEFIPTILEGTRYGYSKPEDIYVIGESSGQGEAGKAMFTSELFELKYRKAEEVKNLLPGYIPTESVKVINELNALSMTSSRTNIQKLRQFVDTIDKASPVVMIEALVVDYSTDFEENLNLSGTLRGGGSELTVEPGQFSGTFQLGRLDEMDEEFEGTLQALVSNGKADIKARPKISTVTGEQASMRVATEEFFRVTTGNVETPLTQLEKIESGVRLEITPYVSDQSDQIQMDVTTEVSAPGQVNAEGLPAINTREAQTTITIPNNETIVIGGLIQERETETTDRTKWLGHIPLLGQLFTGEQEQTSKNELVFYITPRLITNYDSVRRQEDGPAREETTIEEN